MSNVYLYKSMTSLSINCITVLYSQRGVKIMRAHPDARAK